jgi:hypothetical protein
MWRRLAPLSFADAFQALRLLRNIAPFVRDPLSRTTAREGLADRLAHRDADFLALCQRMVYASASSPYRRLLELAGCEYGDLVGLVAREGLEGALRALLREGVYLTADELKGRCPVVRGTTSFSVDPAGLRNPNVTVHLMRQSSGSRGMPTTTHLDLRGIREQAFDLHAFIDAIGSANAAHAVWYVPGGTAINLNLRMTAAGSRPVRWFSQIDPAGAGLHPRYRWSARVVRAGSLLAARPLPSPQHVPVDRPWPIVQWLTATLRAGRIPHLWAFASSAVVVCQAAAKAGVDIAGARFILSGEPVTAGRVAAVRSAGAMAIPRYSASECGQLGFGCLDPAWPDDLHFPSDLHALIQPDAEALAPGLGRGALLLTSLRPSARLVLLNASLGDLATLSARECGCPLAAVGWRTHLHTVRSEEKVTVGGMTFADEDVRRVLDETLPARFGGSPVDYQLREEEGDGGMARLRLLVHPEIGPLDPQAVADAFLAALGRGSGVERVMELAWRDAGVLRVERRPPEPTTSGKIHHLRQSASAGPRQGPPHG